MPDEGGAGIAPDAALIVVDVQNDFCPGGSLPVPEGDAVVPILNAAARAFAAAGRPVVFTRDWHPARHVSFLDRGGPWPPHCVEGTAGAAYHPGLLVPPDAAEFLKGDDPERDAYSGFEGHRFDAATGTLTGEGLTGWLRERKVGTVYIGGLATDYCVRATALDALKAGFRVVVLSDGVRSVDVSPGDGERALEEIRNRGGQVRPWGR